MDSEYDIIVLGTGLKECILSGLMSVSGKKVLHIDRNNYYGGESASLTPLDELYRRFDAGEPPTDLGSMRDWNVDMVPKFLMANGALVKLLLYTGVTKYLEFKNVEGSYVFNNGKIHKVPCNEKEALETSLMGLLEKNRFRSMLTWVQSLDVDNPDTWKGLDIKAESMRRVFEKFGVDNTTAEFTGHAICLYVNDDYMDRPAVDSLLKMQLYSDSLAKYGKSPYLYPMYGLGELPQAFARLSAVYGGTYMLDRPDVRIEYDADGRVVGVAADGERAKSDAVICDPTYAGDKVAKVGSVVRAICILRHPVPGTNGMLSAQIILPQGQINRKHDIYVCVVSYDHCVASKSNFVAIVSTFVETDNPREELKPGLDLLGEIEQTFYSETDLLEPTDSGEESKVFISGSYDATTHFETTCQDVLNIYERITGEKFDFESVQAKIQEAEAAAE